MPTALDQTILPLVKDLLEQFGAEADFEIEQAEDYDPHTGEGKVFTETKTAKISPPEPFERRFVDGSTVLATDMQVFLSASAIDWTPVSGMAAKFSNERFAVVSVESIYSGEQIAAYRLQLRR